AIGRVRPESGWPALYVGAVYSGIQDSDQDKDCCVSDIFQEVDEEVRREQLQKLWDRYQNYIYAGIFVILAGVGGYRAYEWYEPKRAAETGTAFEAAATLDQEGKAAEAEDAYAKVAADGTASYRDLARVRQAAELAQRDPKLGLAAYEKIA